MEQVGAIATGHDASARAGAEVLAEGGNAVDAAVAAAFAACTCEPTLTGIGGAGFATVRLANGDTHCFDFFASVPGLERGRPPEGEHGDPVDVLFGSTTQTFHVGPRSVAVPGLVAGVLHIHARFGTLPLGRVLEPGITLARDGLRLPPQQAYCHHLLTPILTRTARGRAVFAPAGPMLVSGDSFRQPELAATLEVLARDGVDALYRGELAREIVRWSDEHGSFVTAADLEHYQVVEHAPVHGAWRGLELVAPGPPSSGGALIAFALGVLERAAATTGVPIVDVDAPDGVQLLVASMLASNAVRGHAFDERLYGGGLIEWLASDPVTSMGDEVARAAVHGPVDEPPTSRLGSTTQLSVLDAAGNAVSMTTSTGCGSGEFVGDTGIHLNNMLGEEDLVPVEHVIEPGERLTSMMAPTIVSSAGRPLLVTGSAGSSRLRGAIVQSLLRILESRASSQDAPLESLQVRLDDAVQRPRIHAEGGIVQVEPGYADAAVARLESAGHVVNSWPATNMYFGGANMVAVDEDGTFAAAGDHRRGGGAYVAWPGRVEPRGGGARWM